MRATDTDYSGKFGPLRSGRKWEMYSYTRPADIFWNAYANELRKKGATDTQIEDILRSKDVRYMLDGMETLIERAAVNMAKNEAPCQIAARKGQE